MRGTEFLPVSREEMRARDWYYYDFLVVMADAYIDHPSFGSTLIARLLEAEGYRVAVLAQPDWHDYTAFAEMGKPRFGVFIGGGNLDSMVAHYTVAKRRRDKDLYSPGGKMGYRPDRATIVYANRAREAFGSGTPIIIGGLEASLRRFAHYDYWDDKVRRPILFDAPADLLVYGMGETATREIARRLSRKTPVKDITDVRGTAFLSQSPEKCIYRPVTAPSYESVREDKKQYAIATKLQYDENDPIRGCGVVQPCEGRFLIVNPPQRPLPREELDRLYDLPFVREVHPMCKEPVPAIEEVRFSIAHNRGCFGGCNFCALTFHQGRMVTSRSIESVLREAEILIKDPQFKGYIHDVGGPTANFRHTSCPGQKKHGCCYMLLDKKGDFFRELVDYHISGQLKVAPEHCVSSVLDYMGKPHFDVFEKFWRRYQRLNEADHKEQYLVPYLMSSHPGCTLADSVRLAEFLHKTGHLPEQVQDFYPTPGTISTCMYYTGIDPRDMTEVYVARSPHEKALQRALLQWGRKDLRPLVIEALEKAERTDLIGYEEKCLIRPQKGEKYFGKKPEEPTRPDRREKPRGGNFRHKRPENPGQKGKMPQRKKEAFAKRRKGK